MKTLLIAISVAALAIGGAEAGNGRQQRQGGQQAGQQDGQGNGQRLRKRDGTGNGQGQGERLRKRDGSCGRQGEGPAGN